jgi:hypothetical protein
MAEKDRAEQRTILNGNERSYLAKQTPAAREKTRLLNQKAGF